MILLPRCAYSPDYFFGFIPHSFIATKYDQICWRIYGGHNFKQILLSLVIRIRHFCNAFPKKMCIAFINIKTIEFIMAKLGYCNLSIVYFLIPKKREDEALYSVYIILLPVFFLESVCYQIIKN